MNVALHSPGSDLTAISLCTGAGALDLALGLAIPAFRPVLYVEREAFCVAHLVGAIEAGFLAAAPIWSDTASLAGRRFRGCVDLVFGGIPCQPHSIAGPRRGADDERDLWPDTRRILVQSGAWAVFIENVSGLLSNAGGGERVWRELRRLGFEIEGGLFAAAEVGATHDRERLFILAVHPGRADAAVSGRMADPDRTRSPQRLRQRHNPRSQQPALERSGGRMGDTYDRGHRGRTGEPIRSPRGRTALAWSGQGQPFPPGPYDRAAWRAVLALRPHLEPVFRRSPHGVAGRLHPDRGWPTTANSLRLDRLRLLGNGVVPLAAAYAFRTLADRLAARVPGAARLVRMTS